MKKRASKGEMLPKSWLMKYLWKMYTVGAGDSRIFELSYYDLVFLVYLFSILLQLNM